MIKLKPCGKCGFSLSLFDEFYKDATNSTGRSSYCKKCTYKSKAKEARTPERIKEIQKIMSVGINPRKTQMYYMRREVPLETKQVRLR